MNKCSNCSKRLGCPIKYWLDALSGDNDVEIAVVRCREYEKQRNSGETEKDTGKSTGD